jgi:hypothetical protein
MVRKNMKKFLQNKILIKNIACSQPVEKEDHSNNCRNNCCCHNSDGYKYLPYAKI